MHGIRQSKSALLKSKIDYFEHRLRELEATAADLRQVVKKMEEEATPAAPPPAPRPPVVRRTVELPVKVKVVKVGRSGRTTKFSPEVLNSIPGWIEQGLTREQIVEKIGCTMGSLMATCCRKGISLWSKDRTRNHVVQVIYEKEEAA